MKWLKFIPPKNLLQQFEGIENGLRQNQRIGRIGWIGFMVSLAPIMSGIIDWWSKLNWDEMKAIPWRLLLNPGWLWQQISFNHVVLISFLSVAVFVFLIIWNRFWLQESNNPFRYTFSLETFKPVMGDNIDADQYMTLLSHHLCDKINDRIGRLLLLDESRLTDKNQSQYEAHIHISGYYTKRKERNGKWILEIMPRVRIGPPETPETLAYPIRYPLESDSDSALSATPPVLPLNSETEKYEQILERLYFTAATEIYKQIQINVSRKIALLPSDYFRAVALFYEAEDYARSNTLEAYDQALQMYAQSIYQFDPTLRPFSTVRGKKTLQRFGRFLTKLRQRLRHLFAFIWPRLAIRELMQARAEIGYARMKLFRRTLAGILGQKIYPVFDTRTIAERAARRIERLPAETPDKTRYLFEAYVTCALAWAYLESLRKARNWLGKAQMLAPNLAADDPLYNFVYGEVESHLRTELQIFQRVVELEPRFEVALFSLAYKAEYLWRTRPSLERNVAELVLKQYEEVLKLNPGNVGAWANRGYIRWLLGEPEDLRLASEDYRSGREYKDIKRETFVAELDHGLARIAAEQGSFTKAYRYYTSAASANVTHAISNYIDYYYQLTNNAILQRYRQYLDTVEHYWKAWEHIHEPEREFRELITAFCSEAGQADKNIKKMNLFIAAVLHQNSFVADSKIGESLEHKIQQNEKFFGHVDGCATPKLFLTLLQHKLDGDLSPAEKKLIHGIVLDPDFALIMKRQLDGKANNRVRNSILAFAYNDYGDASYYYYLQEGDERFYDSARKAYERSAELNPSFVIPYFNLQRLSTWKGNHEKSREYLETIIRLEPNWPDGKLALAEVNSRLTTDRQKKVEEEQKKAEEKQLEVKNLEDKIHQHQHEVDQLREKISRIRQRTLTETGQPMMPPFPAEQTPEERILTEFQQQVSTWTQDVQTLKNEIEEHQQNADRLHTESMELAEEALNNLRSLLPHHAFWQKVGGHQQFNLDITSMPDKSKWEKELNHVHVYALYYLALVLKSQKQPKKAVSLLVFIRQHFWPAEAYELRNILRDGVEKTVLKRPVFNSIRQNECYRRLLNDEHAFSLLLERNYRQLSRTNADYRQLMQNKNYRDFLRCSDHHDYLHYLDCLQSLFDVYENWLLTSQYTYWALSNIAFDSAFTSNQEGPLRYRGFKFKTQKDCFVESSRAKNRSEFFYYWLGSKMKEQGFEQEALTVWKHCDASKDPYILVKLAADFKSLRQCERSLELFRQALKYDRRFSEKTKAEYHHQCGTLLWMMASYDDALKEFEKIESSKNDSIRRMAAIIDELLPHTHDRESYDLLKRWLHSRERWFAYKGFDDAREDARSARMQLIRDKYLEIQTGKAVSRHAPTPMLPVVTPIAVEIDAGVFADPALPYSDEHPIMNFHYPALQRRLEKSFGLTLPRLRIRVNDSVMASNTYIIMIMEVPIVQGSVEPDKKFLTEYPQFQPQLENFKIDIKAAYDPCTGESDGIWLSDEELKKMGISQMEVLDPFQYIVAHLEAVIADHFSSFLDIQKTDDLLSLWQSPGEEGEAESRRKLVSEALPDLASKIRLVEVLRWLLNEQVSILNLKSILAAFKANNATETDIAELVDAVRFSIRDELPGNDSSYHFLDLSPEFEAEVQDSLQCSNGKLLFAIEPQTTQGLLESVRETVSGYRHGKTVIVTRTGAIRFHVRRLLELEFPDVKILSLRELQPNLHKLIAETVQF